MTSGLAKTAVIILIFCELAVSTSGEDSYEKLQLSNGKILGKKLQTKHNTIAYVYLGVPYAETPIGDLRYRAPVPKKAWSDLFNTQQYKPACMQNASTDGSLYTPPVISEDCLHVNVFTSENCLRTSKRCAVIYYIHGGGWQYDTPTMFDPVFLADNFPAKDVIIITVGYRLGSFGFLNTGKKSSAEKNVGLLDIREGLRWVQREVGFFGGDKNRVTLMGHSSGAMTVDMLSVLPSFTGLFNQIVMMSGSAGDLQKDANVPESKALAVKAGCASNSSWAAGDQFEAILTCLRSKSGRELLQIQRALESETISFMGPTIEEGNGIIVDELSVLRKSRKPYRCLAGTLISEFRDMIKIMLPENGTQSQELLQIACERVASDRGYHYVHEIGTACAKDYSKRHDDVMGLTEDESFHVPIYELEEVLRSKGATVFKYSFEYEGVGGAFNGNKEVKLMHTYDLVYVMGIHMGKFTEKDEKIREIYSSAFVNFAKTGDPTMTNAAKWEPTDDRNNYFKVDFDENLKMPGNTNGYHADAVKFWTVTAKNLDDTLTEHDPNDLRARDINAASPSSSCCQTYPYISAFFMFLCVALVAGVLYRSRRTDKNLDPETALLNVKAMKTYS